MTKIDLQQRVDAFSNRQGRNLDHGTYLEELELDFRDVCLDDRNLSGAVIPGSNFSDMTLENVDFYGANLGGADFSGAVLKNVDFAKANLDNANFTNATVVRGSWYRATCIDAQVAGLTFSGTNLERTFPQLS
jgi:uncharacterized protein YjbI with pentapeptide repeats